MTRYSAKKRKTLMSGKFFSMLLGGTLNLMVSELLLVSDSIIAGKFVDTDAVAGITLVMPMYAFAGFLGSLFTMGIPILYPSEMGEFDKEAADRTFGLGLLMSIISCVFLFLWGAFHGPAHLEAVSTPEPVLDAATDYFSWIRFSMMLLPLKLFFFSIVYSDGDESLSAVAYAVSGIGNIILSIALARRIGVGGIALSSFLFDLVAIAILMIHFLKKSNSLRLNLYFSMDLLKKLLRYSIIDATSDLFIAILADVLNTFVCVQYGGEYLVMVTIIEMFIVLQQAFDGVGEAINPILGIYIGERSLGGARSIMRLACKASISEGIAMNFIMFACAPYVPRILDISDPVLLQQATAGIRILSFSSVFVSLLFLISSYCLLAGKIVHGLVLSVLSDVVLNLAFAIGLGTIFGISGLFAGIVVAPAVAVGIGLLYCIRCYGRDPGKWIMKTLPGISETWLFDLAVNPEEIIDVQKKTGELLAEKGIDEKTIARVELLIEELYMFIYEKNAGKEVLSECTVLLQTEGVQIIMKDDGELFDISDEDAAVTSLASYVVSLYMEKIKEDKHHLTTLSFNRNSFLVKPEP